MSTFLDKIKQMVPGTAEYKEITQSQSMALEIIDRWSRGELVYSQLKERIDKNKDFYMGEISRQFNGATVEGELRIVTNVGATVIDLIVYLLSNTAPSVQATPNNRNKMGQVEASVAEDLIKKAFKLANFEKTFRNSCWMMGIGGFVWWYPFWNQDTEFGRKKNRFDFSMLNPLTTRVFFQDTDYEKVAYFITTKRMEPSVVYEIYGIEALPDAENPFLPQEIRGEGLSEQKVTVFKQYDSKTVQTVIDNKVVVSEEHGLDFAPLIAVNNKFVVNEAHGLDDVFRMLPVAQELNMLISAASEIARDLGWPALLEYNGALGNKRLPKMRGNKIPVRRTDKGEALEYMVNPAQMEPLLKQIELLLDLFHFVSLMPKAAAGVFDSSVTSGFQARIAMQPATLSTENKRIDFEQGIIKLAKTALYLIEKNDPKVLEIDENTRLTGLYDLDFEVVWPDNLPIDIAREIQNLVIGIQNSLTSVRQGIDKYNVLMGMGSAEETLDYLKQEAKESEVAPERALKVAQVQQALSQIDQSLGAIREKLGVSVLPEDAMPGGNQTNAERAMASSLPEEKQQAPESARESLPLESTGGALPEGGNL